MLNILGVFRGKYRNRLYDNSVWKWEHNIPVVQEHESFSEDSDTKHAEWPYMINTDKNLFKVYLTTFSVPQTTQHQMRGSQWIMNWKWCGSGRGLI
jgi:hypothetical protein